MLGLCGEPWAAGAGPRARSLVDRLLRQELEDALGGGAGGLFRRLAPGAVERALGDFVALGHGPEFLALRVADQPFDLDRLLTLFGSSQGHGALDPVGRRRRLARKGYSLARQFALQRARQRAAAVTVRSVHVWHILRQRRIGGDAAG